VGRGWIVELVFPFFERSRGGTIRSKSGNEGWRQINVTANKCSWRKIRIGQMTWGKISTSELKAGPAEKGYSGGVNHGKYPERQVRYEPIKQ